MIGETLMDQPQPHLFQESDTETEQPSNASPNKFGTSIFKKWIYAKFDAKIILEVVQKDIYYNLKLAILLPTLNPDGKKKFLNATLDLKSLKSLQTEIGEAIKILEAHITTKAPKES